MTIDKLFPELPEYDPHPDLWVRIESDLSIAERFDKAVSELPQFEPKADLWNAISDDLDGQVVPIPVVQQPEETSWRSIRPLWATIAVAASVAIILTGIWVNQQPDASEHMEYAVETGSINTTASGPVVTDADQRAEAFIRQQCATQTLACQQSEVHELRNQLTELTTEQQRLEQERQTFGDDPGLIRAQVKMENQRVEITKELIMLLRS